MHDWVSGVIWHQRRDTTLYYGGPSVGISAVSVDECAGSPSPLLLSLSHGTVPQQWKKACIVAHPAEASDYRPISITPVLSRMLEKHLVRSFIYPATTWATLHWPIRI